MSRSSVVNVGTTIGNAVRAAFGGGAKPPLPKAFKALDEEIKDGPDAAKRQRDRLAAMHAMLVSSGHAPSARARALADGVRGLHELGAFESEAGANVLTGLGEVLAQLDADPGLTLVGMFNAGKSSVVNSLVGDDLAVVDVKPTTAVTASYHRGVEARYHIHRDGISQEVGREAYRAMTHRGAEADAMAGVTAIRVEHPAVALRDLVLVDTPGFGAGHSGGKADEDRARAQMREAGAIVWVVDCNRGLQQMDLDALKAYPRDGRLRFALLNKADQKPPSERRLILETFKREHGKHFDDVILYSASLRTKRDTLRKQGSDLSPSQSEFLDLDWDRTVLERVRAASATIRARAVAMRVREQTLATLTVIKTEQELLAARTAKLNSIDFMSDTVSAVNKLGSKLEKEMAKQIDEFIHRHAQSVRNAIHVEHNWIDPDEYSFSADAINGLVSDGLERMDTLRDRLQGIVEEAYEHRRRRLITQVNDSIGQQGAPIAEQIQQQRTCELAVANAVRVPIAYLEGCMNGMRHLSTFRADIIAYMHESNAHCAENLRVLVEGELAANQMRSAMYGNWRATALPPVPEREPAARSHAEFAFRSLAFPVIDALVELTGDVAHLQCQAAFLTTLIACTDDFLTSLGAPHASA